LPNGFPQEPEAENTAMTETSETAGVVAPPPLVALAAVILGAVLDWLLPAYVLSIMLSREVRITFGSLLVAAGIVLAGVARTSFVRANTKVNPYKPSSALVTTGIFAYVRNPMYVGLALMVGGIGLARASDWTLVLLFAGALLIHFGVVRREERYLEAKFGETYRDYMRAVPRYGLRL
jgi:protein-S-isoprenylcysteine O-methyltransferase Ste14